MRIDQAAAKTHPGARREHNEDAVLVVADPPIYAVADGMGGPGVGRRAAELALDTVRAYEALLEESRQRVAKRRSTRNRLALSNLFDALFNTASANIQVAKNDDAAPTMGSTMVPE